MEEQRHKPRYAVDSHTLWTMYFQRRREEQIASTNGVIPRDRLNTDGRREWWGMPGRTLEVVLDHIETGNVLRLENPPRSLITHKYRGSQQFSRVEYQPKFIDSTQGAPKNILKY